MLSNVATANNSFSSTVFSNIRRNSRWSLSHDSTSSIESYKLKEGLRLKENTTSWEQKIFSFHSSGRQLANEGIRRYSTEQ